MQEIAFLERLGLPRNAAMAYLALLEIGEGTVSDIAHKAKLHRAEIYRVIPLLEEYRLLSPLQIGKRTYYRAAPAETLEWLKEDFIRTANEVMERLKKKTQLGLPARLEHVQGVNSISKIYEEALRLTPKGWSYYRYSSGRAVYERSMYLSNDYINLKNTKGIGRYVITNEHLKTSRKPDPNRATVAVPADFDLFNDNISKLIYADRVAIVDHDSKEAFVIESPRFAEFEKKVFRLLFQYLEGRKK